MALKATVFKATIQFSDLVHHDYRTIDLTLARHPSETDLRLMVRLAAWMFSASQNPVFTRGLSTAGEPDIWVLEPTGDIRAWIDVGLPDARRIRKACQQAAEVLVYAYGDRNAATWRHQSAEDWRRFDRLVVEYFPTAQCKALEQLSHRNMKLQCTLEDRDMYLSDESQAVHLCPERWYPG